ncbi:hypothetical protein EVAR_65562_1 [Eumeta japonica]|uniref:Uncharacterized protein n=1 Tax=Eumeta variegata TaxID=151549 RepID=A0A4C1ZDE1_EUMVA|nr:hypothetical protein EVAR_65562_1 [Eumeta japonica]
MTVSFLCSGGDAPPQGLCFQNLNMRIHSYAHSNIFAEYYTSYVTDALYKQISKPKFSFWARRGKTVVALCVPFGVSPYRAALSSSPYTDREFLDSSVNIMRRAHDQSIGGGSAVWDLTIKRRPLRDRGVRYETCTALCE